MPRPGPDTVRKAIEHLERGEAVEALSLLGPYVLRNPEDLEGLYRFGVGLLRTGQGNEAVRVFSRVLEADPGHGRALAALGRTRLLEDDPLGAEPLLRMATRAAPEERSSWQDLGFCLHALGRNADARLVLHEAAARFPDDVSIKALLLNVELEEGAAEAAERTAERIEASHADELLGLVALLHFACDPPARERATRVAGLLWKEHAGVVPEQGDLLRRVAEAFPPPDAMLLRGEQESVACPVCGARTLRREIRGVVLREDPLDRLAALGVLGSWNRCPCGVAYPRPDPTILLHPDLSLAFVVDAFPQGGHEVGDLRISRCGAFGEPESARPKAETWFVVPLAGASGVALALVGEGAARDRLGSLPEIGELGRAERRARETVTALRRLTASDDEETDSGCPPADSPQSAGLPDWMRTERRGLLGSGIAWAPWPLGHRCRCGADLAPFLFGNDRARPFDPAAVDEAAVAGGPFHDPQGGEEIWGFNCDACGRLHTWLMGVLPAE